MSGCMAWTMNHLKTQFAHVVDLSIAPVFIRFRRLVVSETQISPPRPRDSNPDGLVRQLFINWLIRRMNDDFRARFALLQRGYAADMIHVGVGTGDRLQFKLMFVDGAHNLV